MTEPVPNSILDSTKKKLGLAADYDVFDLDVVSHINSVFFNLHQLGVGPSMGFQIEDSDETWDSFLPPGIMLNAVKTYVYLKVKMLFDQPSTSYNLTSTEELIKELEWRINMMREETNTVVVVVQEPVVSDDSVVEIDGGGADAL